MVVFFSSLNNFQQGDTSRKAKISDFMFELDGFIPFSEPSLLISFSGWPLLVYIVNPSLLIEDYYIL